MRPFKAVKKLKYEKKTEDGLKMFYKAKYEILLLPLTRVRSTANLITFSSRICLPFTEE
ncbi:hypothetical protein C0J52_16789 [Blattella germanica]|nr:hypothetical protein C0J52_16789 [Blattella germanica]